MNDTRLEKVKSQKAKALLMAQHIGASIHPMLPSRVLLLDDDMDTVRSMIEQVRASSQTAHSGKLFLRSCPLTPRHGVLESTAVSVSAGIDGAVDVYKELRSLMLENDEPDGCILVQPFIECAASAVAATFVGGSEFEPVGYGVFGPGHDGVTAGHGWQVVLPFKGKKHSDTSWVKQVNADPAKSELEFIIDEIGRYYLTQIRAAEEHISIGAPPENVMMHDGNAVAGCAEANGKVTVSRIIEVTGLEEVAELEKMISEPEEGLVVFQPNGSMLSHVMAHCRGVGVAFVTHAGSDCPVSIESTYTECDGWIIEGDVEPQPYSPASYRNEFMGGLQYSFRAWKRGHAHLGTFFHQWAGKPLFDPKACAFLGGCYVGWLINAGCAAMLGEMRHSRHAMQNYNTKVGRRLKALIGVDGPPSTRDEYYLSMEERSIPYADITQTLRWMAGQFNDNPWGGGYGGGAWGRGALLAIDTLQAIAQDKGVGGIIKAANKFENAAHNNGWLFNKFCSDKVMYAATNGFGQRQYKLAFKAYTTASHIIEQVSTDLEVDGVHERPSAIPAWGEVCSPSFNLTPYTVSPAWEKALDVAHLYGPWVQANELAAELWEAISAGSHSDTMLDELLAEKEKWEAAMAAKTKAIASNESALAVKNSAMPPTMIEAWLVGEQQPDAWENPNGQAIDATGELSNTLWMPGSFALKDGNTNPATQAQVMAALSALSMGGATGGQLAFIQTHVDFPATQEMMPSFKQDWNICVEKSLTITIIGIKHGQFYVIDEGDWL